jgi:hypothetical protein
MPSETSTPFTFLRVAALAAALSIFPPPADAGWGMGNPPRLAGPPPPAAAAPGDAATPPAEDEASLECALWDLISAVLGPWLPAGAAPPECAP